MRARLFYMVPLVVLVAAGLVAPSLPPSVSSLLELARWLYLAALVLWIVRQAWTERGDHLLKQEQERGGGTGA